MRPSLKSIAAVTVCVLAVPAAAHAGAVAAGPERPVRSGATVTIAYGSEQALRAALAANPARVVRTLPGLGVAEVRPEGPLPAFVAAVRSLPGIHSAERPRARRATGEPALAVTAGTTAPIEWQHHATRTQLVPEWVLRAAARVTIAVIDTGADLTAPDLAAKSPTALDLPTGASTVQDTHGHGTFVSSIAAGSVTNGEGIAGAGGDAGLLVIKAGSPTGFTDLDEARAIVAAVDRGARIINISFGGTRTSAAERRAVGYAAARGVLIVAAAGNEYARGNPVEYPAALLQPRGSKGSGGVGLAVAASRPDGRRASFSNTGTWISLAAPGESVFGAVSALSSPETYPRTPLPGSSAGLYGVASGTSYAAPQVAGAAALVWAANPLLSATDVARILKETATGRGRWTPELGFGVVDVAAAVARATTVTRPASTPQLRLSVS